MATGVINNPLAITKNILYQGPASNPSIVQIISGRTVSILIQATITVYSGTKTLLATFTDGRPAVSIYAVCAVNSGADNKYALFEATADGNLYIYNYTGITANFLYGSVTYLVE